MEQYGIINPEYFRFQDADQTYMGFDQEWYANYWKRLSGCGPTTGAQILYYCHQFVALRELPPIVASKQDARAYMNKMWKYITPSMQGVNTTSRFYKGMMKYAQQEQLPLRYEVCDIPKHQEQRPAWEHVWSFLKDGLNQNIPVAFLNWDQGTVKSLDSWHWVTIISMKQEENQYQVEILDGGTSLWIDFQAWFQSTSLGGGLISFKLAE